MSLFRQLLRRSLRSAPPARTRLRVESLEAREVPAVNLLAIPDSDMPSNKPLFVPVTSTSTGGEINYTVNSSNPGISAEILTGGRSLVFTVTGKDKTGSRFTGTLTLRMFENIAPLATDNIITLVKTGYYDGKTFHRVVNDFVIQGGSPNGDGQGGAEEVSDVRDEFNPQFTFASRGIVAMANARDDNNNAQFFITDPFIIDSKTNTEVPAPLDRRSQFLNFNHTIVGILTSGFDTYQTIMDVPKILGGDGAISSPIDSVTIQSVRVLESDPRNAVLKISAVDGFLGSSVITVIGSEGVETQSKAFTVTSVVDTVNDRPFLGLLGNISTTKNTPATFTLPFTELDAGDTQTFVVGRVVNTANGPVFTTLDPAFATASVDSNGKVTVTPATDFVGSFTITVGVRDPQDRIGSSLGLNDARNFDTEEITVTVTAGDSKANTPPTISDIGNQTTTRGTAVGPINFTVGDAETPAANLSVTVTSSNPTLVPQANVVLGGSGANRTMIITPAANQTGNTRITVVVTDGGNLTARDEFDLTVTAPTSPPPPTSPPVVSITTNKNSTTIGKPVLLSATVNATGGAMQFLSGDTVLGNVPVIDNKAIMPTAFETATTHTVTAKYIPDSGSPVNATAPVTITVANGSAPVVITAEGSTGGTQATLTIKNQDGSVRFTINPYGNFNGLVRAKVGDINNDGQLDAVAVPGFGGGPHIVAYDGATGKLIYQNMIYGPQFRGGLSLDVGDAKALGFDQILVGAGLTGGPRVTLIDASTDTVLLNYFAYSSDSRGGVSVSIGDLRGGNQNNIITGPGKGLAPNVNVYNPFTTSGFQVPNLVGSFLAGSATNVAGIRVGTGPLIGNSRRDVLVGPFNENEGGLTQSFNPIALGVFVGPTNNNNNNNTTTPISSNPSNNNSDDGGRTDNKKDGDNVEIDAPIALD